MQRWLAVAVALLSMAAWPAYAGDAKGTVAYKGRTADVKHAYLVKGPDMVSKQPIRRIILSSKDLSGKIAGCKTMSCTDSDLVPGRVGDLENTRCPECDNVLIERYGYLIQEYHLTPSGTCPACGTGIPGIWSERFTEQQTAFPIPVRLERGGRP